LVQLEPVQQMLGVQAPEPPARLRVVHRQWGYELEVRPACIEAVSTPEMTPGPVDGYKIEIKNVETGSCHSIVREVGWSGLQVQRARVGHLVGAQHEFTASAFNLAGESLSVSILVNVSMQVANPSNPPNRVAGREVWSSTSRESVRVHSPSAESPGSFLEDQQPHVGAAATASFLEDQRSHAGAAATASFLEDQRPHAGAAATVQTMAAPGASTAVLPPPVPVHINTGSPNVYRASFPPLSRRSVSQLSRSIAHASPVVVHPVNEVSARLQTHRRTDLASGPTSHADGLGNRNLLSEGSHLVRTSTPRLQRNLQPLDAPRSRAQSQRPRAQHQLKGNHVLGVRAQQTSLGPSSVQVSLPLERSRIRQQHQPQPQRLHRQPWAQIQDASSAGVALGENPLFSSQAGLSGMFAPVVQQQTQLHSHEWVQPSQLRIENPANPASPSWAELQTHERVQASQLRIDSPANPAPASGARLCEEGEDQLCVVCLTAGKTHAFVPCGHRCVCRSCGSELLREARPCPVCRAQTQSILQIFV